MRRTGTRTPTSAVLNDGDDLIVHWGFSDDEYEKFRSQLHPTQFDDRHFYVTNGGRFKFYAKYGWRLDEDYDPQLRKYVPRQEPTFWGDRGAFLRHHFSPIEVCLDSAEAAQKDEAKNPGLTYAPPRPRDEEAYAPPSMTGTDDDDDYDIESHDD